MILIADFDDERRNLLEDYIQEDLGISALGVNSARAMMAKINEMEFELVVVNFQLPDMNGKEWDFLRKIRARFTQLELPIIQLEDENKPDAIAKALSYGCNDCITLPMKMPIAVARIRNQVTLRGLVRKQTSGQAMPSLVPEEPEPVPELEPPHRPPPEREMEIPVAEEPSPSGTTSTPSLSDWIDSLSNPDLEPLDNDFLDESSLPEPEPEPPAPEPEPEPPAPEPEPALAGADSLSLDPDFFTPAPEPIPMPPAEPEPAAPHPPVRLGTSPQPLRGPMSLKEWIRHMGNAAEDECAAVLLEMARALAYAHQKSFIHREVSSETVTVFPDGEVLINGVGVGTQITAKGLRPDPTITNPIRGMPSTPIYASPEQLKGLEADHRADIYTFGILAYEVLAGRPPFYGQSLSAIVDNQIKMMPPSLMKKRVDIDLDLDALVFKCIKKTPDQRFQTATDLVRALESLFEKKYQPKRPDYKKPAPGKVMSASDLDIHLEQLMAEHDAGKGALILEKLTEDLKKDLPSLDPDEAVRMKNKLAEPSVLEHVLNVNLNRNNASLLYQFFITLNYNKVVINLLNHFNRERDVFKKQTLGELAVLSADGDLLSLVVFGLELEDSDACILLKAFGEVADKEPQHIFLKWARHRGFQTQMELLRIVSAGHRPADEVKAVLEQLASQSGTVHSRVRKVASELMSEI
ncbi:MAG: protein kinase [Acidobacteriota bacterium]|nr:protein kinase [Acidobacteriota bacterium]